MKKIRLILCGILLSLISQAQNLTMVDSVSYLSNVKQELLKTRPENRTINLVFHGHSVPSGYWANYEVHTLESYPQLVLEQLKEKYPKAVINVIITAIPGEYSEKGQPRVSSDVLPHRPDVVFIDYALNDIGIGLERAKAAWEKMIKEALAANIEVVLVTPSPDQRYNLLEKNDKLRLHAEQIKALAAEYNIALADPYAVFAERVREGEKVETFMSSVNHPNRNGHEVIAGEIIKLF